MKILWRILVIVAVMALVMGITYFVVNAGGISSNELQPFDQGGRGLQQQNGQFEPRERPPFQEGQFEGRGEGRGRGGGSGWIIGLVKNVGVIAALVTVIVLPKGIIRKKRRSKPALA